MRNFFMAIVFMFLASTLTAQLSVSLNFNVGSQPIWGPVGYDYVEYYYLPDIETYYYVPQQRYYYYEGGNWISRSYLPARYSHYDLYNSYKVVVNEKDPWRNNKVYKNKYSSFKGRHDQQMIKNSHDQKYFVNKNHPEHNKWVQKQNNGNKNNFTKGNNNQIHKQNNGNKNDKNKGNNGNGGNKNNKEKNNGKGKR